MSRAIPDGSQQQERTRADGASKRLRAGNCATSSTSTSDVVIQSLCPLASTLLVHRYCSGYARHAAPTESNAILSPLIS
jgi:hypothetical protein